MKRNNAINSDVKKRRSFFALLFGAGYGKVISNFVMKCHLCLEERKLIKAHIIPESFFLPLRSSKRAPEIHSNIDGEYPKKSPIGIYDKSILCSECDSLIGDWDNYAQQLLLKDFTEDLAVHGGAKKVAYKIDSFNYHKLKLFFVSVLWRASISNHYFYRRVKLGPYQSVARKMILEKRTRAGRP